MILFYGFCGWKPRFSIKWVELGQKPWFSVKNRSFQPKTAVFGLGSYHIWKAHWKPQFLAENCSFQLGSSTFENRSFWGWKLQFLAENHGFWLKTAVFSVVFNCGRSQGIKLPKTVVFSVVFSVVFNCDRSQGLKLPKTWFSVCFSDKNCGFDLRKHGFHQNHGFQPKPCFLQILCDFELKTKLVFQT